MLIKFLSPHLFLCGLFLFFAASAAAAAATVTAAAAAVEATTTVEAATDAAAYAATAEAVLLYNICRVSEFEPKILRLQSGVLPMCYIYLLNNEHTPIELSSPLPNL